MQLDEGKPFKVNVRGLNLVTVGPVTMQVTNCHFRVVKYVKT
jgi:hypothetical protein